MPETNELATDAGELVLHLRQSLMLQLLTTWNALDTYHTWDVPAFVDAAAPAVLGAQKVMIDIAHDYVSSQWRALGWAAPPRPSDAVASGAAIRNGVSTSQVYRRPFIDVWSALADDHDLDVAASRGALRLTELADTDLQLAHNHAVRDMYVRGARAAGYRRVLVGTTNCALCIIASTQRYRRGDLMPMHPHCNCKTEPIYGRADHVLAPELVDAVHKEIAARFGISDAAARRIDYRKVLLTRDHGEYGPTLTYARDMFTGPDDLNRPAKKSPPRRERPPGGKTL